MTHDGLAMDRRRFLDLCRIGLAGTAAAAVVEMLASTAGPAQVAGAAGVPEQSGSMLVGGSPMRPPAVPLAVRDPYCSTWLCGTNLAGRWSTNWAGNAMPVCGLIRIDGRPFVWCGDPRLSGVPLMTQTAVSVTPTRTIFTLEASGVRLVAEWLSPVEPGNPALQSVPLSLLMVRVAATDGHHHEVQLYCDISGQWASWVSTDQIVWQTSRSRSRHWTVQLANEQPLEERNEMAAWGSAVLSTPSTPFVTYQSGGSTTVRTDFVKAGRLADSVDPKFRAIDDNWPVFGLARDLGRVGKGQHSTYFSLGHFEKTWGLKYLNENLPPFWQSNWDSWQTMVDDFLSSAEAARSRAIDLDDSILSAATKAGGPEYAALCALALRQAYGGCQIVKGPDGRPWSFLKELSSGGYISTADVIFDSCAVWLHLDPGYVPMLLEPLLDYASSSQWREDYAPHSLGLWPVAFGNPKGPSSEPMPVQESAGMLIMAAAYAARVPTDTATAFLSQYKALWSKWADLLISQLPVPPSQLTTIDYMGSLKANTNLAALGIIGLAAASQIADRLGDKPNASKWSRLSKKFANEWVEKATNTAGKHLEAAMGSAKTWSNVCNAVWDDVLGTGLIPVSVAEMQASFYRRKLTSYGLAVDNSWGSLGRVDQQLWTATWLRSYRAGLDILSAVHSYAEHTSYTAPFPDTYDTIVGGPSRKRNWRARPVVGGVFALLCVPQD
jgi:hypothetical protein